jgi:hypothetical protein
LPLLSAPFTPALYRDVLRRLRYIYADANFTQLDCSKAWVGLGQPDLVRVLVHKRLESKYSYTFRQRGEALLGLLLCIGGQITRTQVKPRLTPPPEKPNCVKLAPRALRKIGVSDVRPTFTLHMGPVWDSSATVDLIVQERLHGTRLIRILWWFGLVNDVLRSGCRDNYSFDRDESYLRELPRRLVLSFMRDIHR